MVRKGKGLERESTTSRRAESERPQDSYGRQYDTYTNPNATRRVLPPVERTQYRDHYAAAVESAYRAPVISARAAADSMAGSPEEASQIAAGLSSAYGGAYLSPQQVAREMAIRSTYRAIEQNGTKAPPELLAKWTDMMRTSTAFTKQDRAVLGVLSGDDINRRTPQHSMAMQLRGLVQEHAPKGKYAEYGARTQAEQDALQKQFGDDANYILTPGQKQNHEALRVHELLSATDENYAPASTMSQVGRYVGGFFGPPLDALRSVTTEPGVYDSRRTGEAWDDAALIARPDGKFGYAAYRWQQGQKSPDAPDTEYDSVFTPEGRSKFNAYDPTTMQGFANASQTNTSFPYAQWYNLLAPVRELPMHVGLAIGGQDAAKVASGLYNMRDRSNRIVPVVPEGMSQQAFREATDKLRDADTKMDGWTSAYFGPKFADAYNAALPNDVFGKMTRTYLSPMANTVMSVPGEMLGDPGNVVMNLVGGPTIGGAMGAVRGGLKGAFKGALKGLVGSVKSVKGDIGEEIGEEAAVLGPLLSGPGEFVKPEKNNLMMGSKDPNDPDYDRKLEQQTQRAMDSRINAAGAWNAAQRRAQ